MLSYSPDKNVKKARTYGKTGVGRKARYLTPYLGHFFNGRERESSARIIHTPVHVGMKNKI